MLYIINTPSAALKALLIICFPIAILAQNEKADNKATNGSIMVYSFSGEGANSSFWVPEKKLYSKASEWNSDTILFSADIQRLITTGRNHLKLTKNIEGQIKLRSCQLQRFSQVRRSTVVNNDVQAIVPSEYWIVVLRFEECTDDGKQTLQSALHAVMLLDGTLAEERTGTHAGSDLRK